MENSPLKRYRQLWSQLKVVQGMVLSAAAVANRTVSFLVSCCTPTIVASELRLSRESEDPESSIICTAFPPILPEMVIASVLVVATVIVGISSGLTLDRDDCCPVQSSLGRFPADCFGVAQGRFVAGDWVIRS